MAGSDSREAPASFSQSIARLALSTEEAAEQLGCSTKHVRRQIAAGALRARKSGARLLILSSDLTDYLERLPSAGRVTA